MTPTRWPGVCPQRAQVSGNKGLRSLGRYEGPSAPFCVEEPAAFGSFSFSAPGFSNIRGEETEEILQCLQRYGGGEPSPMLSRARPRPTPVLCPSGESRPRHNPKGRPLCAY